MPYLCYCVLVCVCCIAAEEKTQRLTASDGTEYFTGKIIEVKDTIRVYSL